jgi:hypothetical protein
MLTVVPGDRVLFGGHEWRVFITSKSHDPDAPVWITRPECPGRACDVIDLLRQRRELTLIPRAAPVLSGDDPTYREWTP